MKDKLPQVNQKTGISCDYVNAYGNFLCWVPENREDRDWLAQQVKEHPVRHYRDYFSSKGYDYVPDVHVVETIAKIDRLADLANELFVDQKNCTPAKVRAVVGSVSKLIQGRKITAKLVKSRIGEES